MMVGWSRVRERLGVSRIAHWVIYERGVLAQRSLQASSFLDLSLFKVD